MRKVVSLELNEVNFDFIAKYCALGKLPNFRRALQELRLYRTRSEENYTHLEPWIQWPSVYSGKSFAEHGVFRLGDIIDSRHSQIWELLEEDGVSVGAISPMNARNVCQRADFFIPDPWTVTKISGDGSVKALYRLVRDAVNVNAHEGRSARQLGMALLPFIARYGSVGSLREYGHILRRAFHHKWARAVFLDRLLTDVFLELRLRNDTQFASLFLNSGAHIQHHYMYDAMVYEGEARNPEWYSGLRANGLDPLLFVYEVYDRVLGEVLALKNTRVLVTTGLSQYPNPTCIYQYRFKNHAGSLAKLGVVGGTIIPRMSRDFLVEFKSAEEAAAGQARLAGVRCFDKHLVTVENRGASLFCQIAWFGLSEGFEHVTAAGEPVDLREDVALVSIENGLHQTTGFHFDTEHGVDGSGPLEIPLTDIFLKMREAFRETPTSRLRAAQQIPRSMAEA